MGKNEEGRSMGKNEEGRDMSKELIERLRADAESTDDIGLCADAADRIEELERKVASRDAEIAELVEALEKASEEIRRCDYTPARSTLLVALAKVRKP